MAMNEHSTAKYKIIVGSGGNRYKFFCDLSGMALCITKPIRAETQEEELRQAWESEGKYHFNRCTKCGKHVSDAMYNADVLRCVDCAPWEKKPRYCAHCGKELPPASNNKYCKDCGAKLCYGEAVVI